ncbi:MFS transporter [Deinococcus roseus]|nr:MFS transporter [Deinococcus roseus]
MPATKLWNKNFTLYWLGTAQSNFGDALNGIALSFLILDLTGSATSMGINLALSMFPGLLSPLAGNLMDRIPLKPPLIVGDVLRGLIALGVVYLASQHLLTVPLIYLITVLFSTIGVMYRPAAGKIFPELVPRAELPRANGLLGTATQSMQLLGLVGGGALISTLGTAQALLIDAITFFIMAVVLVFVDIPRLHPAQPEPFWKGMKAGFQVIQKSSILPMVMGMAFLINGALAPTEVLTPRIMQEMGLGARGYGFWMGAFSAGMVLGSVMVSIFGNKWQPRRMVFLGLFGMGFTLLGMMPQQHLWIMFTSAALMGITVALTNTFVSVLLQHSVDQQYRGRVFGVLGMVAQCGMPLMVLAVSGVADQIPVSIPFMVASVVVVCMSLLWAVFAGKQLKAAQVPA